jgi:hypothetical protein
MEIIIPQATLTRAGISETDGISIHGTIDALDDRLFAAVQVAYPSAKIRLEPMKSDADTPLVDGERSGSDYERVLAIYRQVLSRRDWIVDS